MKSLKEILHEMPELNHAGIDERYSFYSVARRLDAIEMDEETMTQFEQVAEWVGRRLWPIKSINHVNSHVQITALCAKELERPISKGILIAAMVATGYRFHQHKHTPSVFFNVSQRAVNKLKETLLVSRLDR